jgi:SAM-dependent methyltransferase
MPIQRSNEPEAFAEFERKGWAGGIEAYARGMGPITAQTAEPTLDAARVAAGMRVLDVCTGHGVLAAGAARRGAAVSGLDFAEEVVTLARRNVPNAAFERGDAQALPYADGSFDAVVCGYGIMHVPEPDRALAEIFRVLKRGGRAAFSSWARPTPGDALGLVFGAVRAHGRLDVKLPHGPDFFQFADIGAMRAALADAGFVAVEASTVLQHVRLARPGDLLDLIREGTVRSAALLAAQDESARAAIASAVSEAVARFAENGGYRVPIPAIVGSGAKP